MNAEQTLLEIKRRGMRVWPHIELIRFAPVEKMTPDLLEQLSLNKQMILKKLRSKLGVGGEMKRILRTFGIEEKSTCKCNARSATMDLWGPDRCEQKPMKLSVGFVKKQRNASYLFSMWSDA